MAFEFETSSVAVADLPPASAADLVNGKGTETEVADQPAEAASVEPVKEPAVEPLKELTDGEVEAELAKRLGDWEATVEKNKIGHERKIKELKDRQTEAVLLMAKAVEAAKHAKSVHKAAVETLETTIAKGPDMPLQPTLEIVRKDMLATREKSAKKAQSASDAAFDARVEFDPNWASIPMATFLEGIERIGAKKREAIIDAFSTVGKLVEAQNAASKEFATFASILPKGCGQAIADQLEDKLTTLVKISGSK